MGKIDFVDARSAPIDAPSCALKLEHSLCLGIAYGKGCLSEKAESKTTANEVVHSCRNAPYRAERASESAANQSICFFFGYIIRS